jgi:cell division protein FtsI/penicillin-binding protein 2
MLKDFQKLVYATNKQNSLFNKAKKTNKYDMASSPSVYNKPVLAKKNNRNYNPKSKFGESQKHNTNSLQSIFEEKIVKLKENKFTGMLIGIVSKIALFIFGVFFFWTVPFFVFVQSQMQYFTKWLNIRENVIKLAFTFLFVVMIFNLFSLQVLGSTPFSLASNNKTVARANNIMPAKKGNIYFRDLAQSRDDIPLTTNSLRYNAVFNPSILKQNLPVITQNLKLKSQQETLSQISLFLASQTNISSQDLQLAFNQNIDFSIITENTKKSENPWGVLFSALTSQKPATDNTESTNLKTKKYGILKKEITQEQSNAIDRVRDDEKIDQIYLFTTWLSQAEQITVRSYPEGKTLGQTIGYSLNSPVNSTEANSRKHCRDMVEKNQNRDTEIGEFGAYQIGSYGLEQRYCSELGGVNGRSVGNVNLTNPDAVKNQTVQNGANIYLNFDKNIQKKAEQILEQAVIKNTNAVGGPKDGCLMVMEAGTGNILAMASYPAFDPNRYADYFSSNSKSLINNCIANDYEVGSVMKPLTVAAAITNRQNGGNGVDPNYSFVDYDEKGKEYKDGDGIATIQNAKNYSWRKFGNIGLKEIIRDSINTGIANIIEITGSKPIKEFFLDKLEFGHYGDPDYNLPNFAGSINGDTQSFDSDVYCEFCYANKAFGQGFSISALQLIRAYTALTNDGSMVQPQWINKMQCSDGSQESLNQRGKCVSDESHLKPNEPKPVFTKRATDAVTGYMLAANEEGYLGSGPTKAMVDGYRVAIKSGTAQVSRPIIESNGKTLPCNAECNTKRGLTDHTMIGYNTGKSRYIVMLKLAEPNPGIIENFSSTTLPTFFSDMMKYTLEYMSVPKER